MADDPEAIIADILERRTFFTYGDLLDTVADRYPEASHPYIERIAEDIAVGPALVELRGAGPATEVSYTTPAVLAAVERRVVDRAADRDDAGRGVAGDDELAGALARRPQLSQEQRVAVGELATSGRRVDVFLHRGGSGKDAVLEAAGAAWDGWGPRVMGAAATEAAAADLQRSTGITTWQVDELLDDVEYPRAGGGGLPRGFVLLVDDANLIPDHTLTRLLDGADGFDTKIVLVADERSHADGPRGAFGAIMAAAEPVTAYRATERETTAREAAAETGGFPPHLRGLLASREAERSWLARRVAREEARLTELGDALRSLPGWQRGKRRDLAEQITDVTASLGAAKCRLADLDRGIASIHAMRHRGPRPPAEVSDSTSRQRHLRTIRDRDDAVPGPQQREAHARGHGRGGR